MPAPGPGDRSRGLGLLNSITNGGQIVGTVVAGLMIAWFSFAAGFWTVALTGGAAKRLAEIVPSGHEARVHLTLTDDHPWAQAFVVIEARAMARS